MTWPLCHSMSQPVQRLILSMILYISSTTGTLIQTLSNRVDRTKNVICYWSTINNRTTLQNGVYLRPSALFKQPKSNFIWCGLYEHWIWNLVVWRIWVVVNPKLWIIFYIIYNKNKNLKWCLIRTIRNLIWWHVQANSLPSKMVVMI